MLELSVSFTNYVELFRLVQLCDWLSQNLDPKTSGTPMLRTPERSRPILKTT
jgi:hypothetical protein